MDNHTSRRIVREPLPPAIPRRAPARLAWFERLWFQVAVDAANTLDEMRADGWSDESARQAMAGYTNWITGNIGHAVELAMFLDELEAA